MNEVSEVKDRAEKEFLKKIKQENKTLASSDDFSINGIEYPDPGVGSPTYNINAWGTYSITDFDLVANDSAKSYNASANAWVDDFWEKMFAYSSSAGAGYGNSTAALGKGIFIYSTSDNSPRLAHISFDVYSKGIIYAAGGTAAYKIKGFILDESGNILGETVLAEMSRSMAIDAVNISQVDNGLIQVWLTPGKKYSVWAQLETTSESYGNSVYNYSAFGDEDNDASYFANLREINIDWQ